MKSLPTESKRADIPLRVHARSRQRDIAFRAVSAAGGVLVAILILEIACRVFLYRYAQFIERLNEHVAHEWGGDLTLRDIAQVSQNSERVYELRPNAHGTFGGQPLRVNSAGFRDRDWSIEKPSGAWRIAVLGDSVAFGWGVRVEDRFSNLLEPLLSAQTTGSLSRVECLNFAVPGYNTVQELATLRSVVLRYAPDVVLVNLVENDDEVPNFIRLRPRVWSLSQSFLLETVRDRLVGRKLGDTARLLFGGIAQAGGSGHGAAVRGFRPELVPPEYRFLVGSENMTKALVGIHDECSSRGIAPVCLIHYTDLDSILDDWPHSRVNHKMTAWKKAAEDAGFTVCDPLERFVTYLRQAGARSSALWISTTDHHPNALAHRLIAEELVLTLREVMQSHPRQHVR